MFMNPQIKWAKDNLDGYLNFYSVSGDGRVTNWTIVKTALWFNDTLNIQFSKNLANFSVTDSKCVLRGIRKKSFYFWRDSNIQNK